MLILPFSPKVARQPQGRRHQNDTSDARQQRNPTQGSAEPKQKVVVVCASLPSVWQHFQLTTRCTSATLVPGSLAPPQRTQVPTAPRSPAARQTRILRGNQHAVSPSDQSVSPFTTDADWRPRPSRCQTLKWQVVCETHRCCLTADVVLQVENVQ